MNRLIVCVGGWGSPRGLEFRTLARRLCHVNYDVIVIGQTNLTGIVPAANRVAEVIEAVQDKYDFVGMIGHSLGGLVARQVRADLHRVDGLVTLGTPHEGASIARLASWWSRSAKDALPGSKFLAQLDPWPTGVPALSLTAGSDLIVPWASSQLSGAENIIVGSVGHTTMLYKLKVFYEIWAWLCETFFPADFTSMDLERSMCVL